MNALQIGAEKVKARENAIFQVLKLARKFDADFLSDCIAEHQRTKCWPLERPKFGDMEKAFAIVAR